MSRPIAHIALAWALLGAVACGDDGATGWQVEESELPGALFSVWANTPDDVWAVGADPGDGPVVLRYDGSTWERQTTGATGDLWWVYGFPGGPVYLGGEGGLILRHDGAGFTTLSTPGNGTVFGIWGASPAEMWAVGGNLGGASGAFAWRLDGDTWIEAAGFPTELAAGDAMWKVFGRSASDVFLVGTRGVILHFDGADFTTEDSGTTRGLFTVHGTAERMVAVGGFGTGMLLERDATGWRDATPSGAPQLIGVAESAAAGGYAVGMDGVIYHRAPGASVWELETTDTGLFLPLHAVSIDSEGGAWAAGGQILSAPFVDGVLLHKAGTP